MLLKEIKYYSMLIHWYFLASFLYRKRIPFIPKLIYYLQYILFNSSVPASCKIGKGTKFGYGGIGVVIHSRAVVGNNCLIGQNTTIGGRSGYYEVPKIGNNVEICAGARVLGPITIGDNAIIGANAVVINDVPENAVVVGVPAKVIKFRNNE